MMTLPPITRRDRLGHFFVSTLLFVAGIAPIAAMPYISPSFSADDDNFGYVILAMSSVSVFQILIWWFSFVSRTSLASSPIAMQLIPRFRQRVLTNSILILLGFSVALAAIFAGIHAVLPLIWIAALSFMFSTPLARRVIFAASFACWLGIVFATSWPDKNVFTGTTSTMDLWSALLLWSTGASLLGIVAIARLHQWLGSALSVAFVVSQLMGLRLPGFSLMTELTDKNFVASPAYALGMTIVALCLCGFALKLLCGHRGDVAISTFRRNANLRAAMAVFTDSGAKANWALTNQRSLVNDASFNRAVNRITTVKHLLPYGISPRLDSTSFAKICVTGAALLLLLPLLPVVSKVSGLTALSPNLAIVLLLGLIALPVAVRRTYREQKLLCLTPKWPSRPALNHWLVSFIATRIAIAWAACVASSVAMTLLYALPLSNSVSAILTSSLCALLLLGYSLKNYAKMLVGRRSDSIGTALLLIGFATIGFIAHFFDPLGTTTIVVAALIVCYASWRVMSVIRGPAILPANRLG